METLELERPKNKRVIKSIKTFDTPTKMTFEEFVEKCERARAEYENGETIKVKREELKKFLGLE